MNTHIFASAVGRWVAPAVLAGATFVGTMGLSSVASAQEVVRVAVPAPRVVLAAPPVVERVVEPRVVVGGPVVSPYYYGPAYGWGGYYGPGYGGYYGRGYGYGYGGRGYGYGGHGYGYGGHGYAHGGGGFHGGGGAHGGGGHGGGGHGGGHR